MRREYQPASLREIDEVRIVDLHRVVVDRVSHYMLVSDAPEMHVVGDVAQKIAALWRQLPSGEQSRCHNPPFGLRFIAAGEFVLEASICWECDNILGVENDVEIRFEFNASAPVSRELLELLKDHFKTRE